MQRNLTWTPNAWEDYVHWQQQDRAILRRINKLITDIQRDPFNGIGKPEALKYGAADSWSRRITDEHRLVYKVRDDAIIVLQARYHY